MTETRQLASERLFVWLGGAAFAGSLVLCAYTFAVRWSRADVLGAGVVGRHVLVNAVLFTLFAAHHSVLARDSVKTWIAGTVPSRLLRSLYVWTASLLLIILLLLWQPLGGDLYRAASWPLRAAHAVIQLAGVWLIARSVSAIDALELAGIRTQTRTAGLKVAGPYRFVRHPLYLGWMLVVFGPAHMTGDRAMFAVITTAYLLVAMPWEERSLERTFGDDYAVYKQQVRWRVIPYVH